jgi:P27 family predicted phage terminase small subunit
LAVKHWHLNSGEPCGQVACLRCLLDQPTTNPPRALGSHGKQLWDRIQAEYGLQDSGGVEILAQLCAALDRAESLREAVERDGSVVYGRGGVPKVHPAVKDELACRAFINRSLERLGLSLENTKTPGRPPRPYGWSG